MRHTRWTGRTAARTARTARWRTARVAGDGTGTGSGSGVGTGGGVGGTRRSAAEKGSATKKAILAGLRWTSLRLRLVVVFGAVALTAAVSASGIAYWLNREAVLTRTQDSALNDFQQKMQNRAAELPLWPSQSELQNTAEQMADGNAGYSVLLIGERAEGKPVVGASDRDTFTLDDVPKSLQQAVNGRQKVTSGNDYPYHVFWLRTELGGTPYLVGGTRIIGGGPTGYLLKSLDQERADLNSLAWSLGIATALALVGSALLAQARPRPCSSPCSGWARRPGSSVRASSGPGCGCRGRMSWRISRVRSTRPPSRCRRRSRT